MDTNIIRQFCLLLPHFAQKLNGFWSSALPRHAGMGLDE
jgi:hypothetical protein